jgi:hypothetical protein
MLIRTAEMRREREREREREWVGGREGGWEGDYFFQGGPKRQGRKYVSIGLCCGRGGGGRGEGRRHWRSLILYLSMFLTTSFCLKEMDYWLPFNSSCLNSSH